MDQSKVDRINELARIAKGRGLTPDETAERQALRKEYIAQWRKNTISTLENTYFDDGEGNITKLEKKK